MVVLNTAYAAPKNAADPKNRVGDFFYEDRASVGQNRWSSRLNTQEKSSYHYEAASGRSNWPSRDPIEEKGGLNLYGMVLNSPINYVDTDGRAAFAAPVIIGGGAAVGEALVGIGLSLFATKVTIDTIEDLQLRRRCQRMRRDMKNTCSNISCKGGDDCSTISNKIDKAKNCGRLRRQITDVCFGGILDQGHLDQVRQAREAADGCRKLHKKKCCDKQS
jgi:RHS repeat-associated protein